MKKTIHTWVTKGKFEHEAEVLQLANYFESKKVKIEVLDSAEEKRTADQNKALWKWDSLLAKEAGYTTSEMHYYMCGAVFGWTEVAGRSVPKKTTNSLTKNEWQDYIRDYRVIARDIYNYEMPPFGYED